ncbi:MAG TPA: HAD-IB family phosphatase [Bacillota bacterium]|nr:HAD-IB family phosphatase [Bacillota bacterium]
MRLIAFDMDGTLTDNPSSWEHIHRRFGLWEAHADAYMKRFLAGEITYAEFSRLDALEWKGKPRRQLDAVLDEIGYAPCAREAVSAAREAGASVALVSSGLSFLASRVARELGICHVFANELAVCDGLMTGEVVINVSIDDPARTKAAILKQLRSALRADRAETWAVGDNWGDIEMLQEAGRAFLVAPRPECWEQAMQAAPHVECIADLCHLVSLIRNVSVCAD